ncbi:MULTISPECIES: FHA domain-containing protein [unclassified Mycobacterium]|uniref:FHA domain-containing protein n=1 Tax=unclassified Mycobacterium TaxID=2642494 RepID=UPI0004914DE1|nr:MULTISPECIES: FHA domain-containing protein [unclassified Mycobacterium]SEA57999.1 FHA domain-containing protein [Mycobacterium sp. 283mftsu]
MEQKRHYVAIGRGEGLVARFGDVLTYVADGARARPLLRVLTTVAPPALPQALAALAYGPESDTVPPFGALVPAGDCLHLIVRGDVIADVEAGGGQQRLSSGGRPLVDEPVASWFDRITICGTTTTFVPCADTDLVAGVVPGGGFVLQSRLARSTAQHAPQPAPATTRARPVTGNLTADDGAVYPLDRAYIIGRNPMIDPAVVSGAASPISLPDDPQVSRVHAYVTVNGGMVLVRDAQTVGGTHIASPGDQTWTQIGDQPVELLPGCYLRIGQKILTYQVPAQSQ